MFNVRSELDVQSIHFVCCTNDNEQRPRFVTFFSPPKNDSRIKLIYKKKKKRNLKWKKSHIFSAASRVKYVVYIRPLSNYYYFQSYAVPLQTFVTVVRRSLCSRHLASRDLLYSTTWCSYDIVERHILSLVGIGLFFLVILLFRRGSEPSDF